MCDQRMRRIPVLNTCVALLLCGGALFQGAERPAFSQEMSRLKTPDESGEGPIEVMSRIPTPQPTLLLKLEKPERILKHKSPRIRRIAPINVPKPTPAQTPGSDDPLSHFEFMIDYKHRPIINYKFTDKSDSAKEADLRNPQRSIE